MYGTMPGEKQGRTENGMMMTSDYCRRRSRRSRKSRRSRRSMISYIYPLMLYDTTITVNCDF